MDNLRILVVDDEARMRKIVRDFLTAKQYIVIEASNGEEALGLYLATLIESGQRMPEMTRLEDVVISNSDIKTYISVDVDKYHRDMRSIKKTVSIPAWQAKAAQKQQLSLSKVLQQALNTILV